MIERHTGRYRVTTRRQDRFLQMTVRRQSNITAMHLVLRLQEDLQLLVSDQILRRRLHEVNLHARRPLCVPAIGNRGPRLSWAWKHLPFSIEQWSLVLLTDEARYGFHPDSQRTRIWRTPGRVSRLRHPIEIQSYQGGTIMVWAGIRLGGRTLLVWIQGIMTAQKYRDEVIEPVIVPLRIEIGQEFLLMHDNAPSHTARLVSALLRAHMNNRCRCVINVRGGNTDYY